MNLKTRKCHKLKGDLTIPGDKSISHRAIIFASLAKGYSNLIGLLESEDCLKTLNAFRLMGVPIERNSKANYTIKGVGLKGLKEADRVIDCGNSGTSMRLLTGLLAAQDFYTVLSGDTSLRKRPMDRIIKPLREMKAKIWARRDNYAPLSIKGSQLSAINYTLPVASAQVKSSLLLAGLYADGKTILREPGLSRDHTERMLQGFGVNLKKSGLSIELDLQKDRLEGQEIVIPADISSAAFFITAALIIDDSELLLRNIGINPSRSGFLKVVKDMGGDCQLINKRVVSGEPVADIIVKSSKLTGVNISGDLIPTLIDELPIIAILASRAEGRTVIKDAAELRVKESDRITNMISILSNMGVNVQELTDGMIINGPVELKGGFEVDSSGDHRIAMTVAIAGLLIDEPILINNSDSIKTSFPEFIDLLNKCSVT